MRYRLRTLVLLMMVAPPLLAFMWFNGTKPSEFIGLGTMLGILALAYWSLGQHARGRDSILNNPAFLRAELERLEARRELIQSQIEATKGRLRDATAKTPASIPSAQPAENTLPGSAS